MTPEEVRSRVKAIETDDRWGRLPDAGWDDERAHSDEDDLYRDVLRAIADGAEEPRELANEALRVMDLDFARWHA